MGKEENLVSPEDYQLAFGRRHIDNVVLLVSGINVLFAGIVVAAPRVLSMPEITIPPQTIIELKGLTVGFACALAAKLIDRKTIRDYEFSTGQTGLR